MTISSQDLIQLLLLTADTEYDSYDFGSTGGIACKTARWTPILWGYGLVEHPGSHKSPVGPNGAKEMAGPWASCKFVPGFEARNIIVEYS